ncbi:MAG: hypothetical protein JNM86_10415 [Phycisphaerae bacterium]|nr:hypothetical protein [Phycisphaerae bacterium]
MRARRIERNTAALLVLCAGALCTSALAAPQSFDWNSPIGGLWSDAANWNPVAVPTLDIDTATIGGALPLTVDVFGANASIGFFRQTNANSELRVRSGRTFSIGQDATLNGTMTIGEEHPTDLTIARFGTLFNSNVTGTGRVVLRASPGDVLRTYVQSPAGRVITWGKDILIRGTGGLYGVHRILGTVSADVPGAALEFRGVSVDGFGSGNFIADGAILRLFQCQVTDAKLETRNGGRIELVSPASPGATSNELLKRATVRGLVRNTVNTTIITDTDFDGELEILPGSQVTIGGYQKPTRMTATVHAGTGTQIAGLKFAQGTPPGGGEIVLDADTNTDQAFLYVHQAKLGSDWRVSGRGSVDGSFTLEGTIVADRPTGPAMLFQQGTIDGTGTFDARGGTMQFGIGNIMKDVRLTSSAGGSLVAANAQWTNVLVDSALTVSGPSFTMTGSVVNGRVSAVSGTVNLTGAPSTIEGELALGDRASNKSGALNIASGSGLLGSGEIVLYSPGNPGSSSLYAPSLTLPLGRPVRGCGAIAGGIKFETMFADDPDGKFLTLGLGTFEGFGVAEVRTGPGALELIGTRSNPSTFSNFRIVAAGDTPVQIGRNSDPGSGGIQLTLKSLDIDAECVVSQLGVDVQNTIFRRGCDLVRAPGFRVRAGTRFEGEVLVRTPPDGFASQLSIEDSTVTVPKCVLINRAPGDVQSEVYVGYSGGTLSSAIRGTGTISSVAMLGGSIAPSDESTGNPVGLIYFKNTAPTFASDFVYEVDIATLQAYDRLDASKGAVANGTLKISIAPDLYPPPTYNFHVIRGSTTGAFTNVIAPSGYRVSMAYNTAGALARLEKLCGSDLNGDGLVDDADFALFCLGYDVLQCADPAMALNCPADLDRDRVVDDADFRMFVRAYSEMTCPTE